MRKEFWEGLRNHRRGIPRNLDRHAALEELVSHLGNTNPQWRDEIAWPILAHWMLNAKLNDDERRWVTRDALDHLLVGVGRREDDSVFRRSFSALILSSAIGSDLHRPFLKKAEVRRILRSALELLDREEDLRGFVPRKGWAHSIAHLADLLGTLAEARGGLRTRDFERILAAISDRLRRPARTVLTYGESVRLARAVVEILHRVRVPAPFLRSWFKSFSKSGDGRQWHEVHDTAGEVNARTNVTLFLAALVAGSRMRSRPPLRATPKQLARAVLRDIQAWQGY